MTQQQINNGTSLVRDRFPSLLVLILGIKQLWLGIVLLEIPSNVILQRVGPRTSSLI